MLVQDEVKGPGERGLCGDLEEELISIDGDSGDSEDESVETAGTEKGDDEGDVLWDSMRLLGPRRFRRVEYLFERF